jgi:hypothetical protein
MQHILLEKAFRYQERELSTHSDCKYDALNGYWVLSATNELLVASDLASCLGTKKEDIETGEDQKGE